MLAILLLCVIPITDEAADEVDIIEINHIYDLNNGQLTKRFTQVLFWRWHSQTERNQIAAWRMWRTDQRPKREGGYFVLRFRDEYELVNRAVRAKVWHESHELYDVEVDERCQLAIEKRGGLSGRVK